MSPRFFMARSKAVEVDRGVAHSAMILCIYFSRFRLLSSAPIRDIIRRLFSAGNGNELRVENGSKWMKSIEKNDRYFVTSKDMTTSKSGIDPDGLYVRRILEQVNA